MHACVCVRAVLYRVCVCVCVWAVLEHFSEQPEDTAALETAPKPEQSSEEQIVSLTFVPQRY